jgi:tetratricopeptide (TPR) repeat protein
MIPETATIPEADRSPQPARKVSARRRRRFQPLRVLGWIVTRFVPIGLLLALTTWNLDHSVALEEAEKAKFKDDLLSTRRAMDRLEHWPPSPKAEKLAALGLSRLGYADLAEPHYRKGEKLDVAEQFVRAFGLVRIDKIDEAIEAYQKILATPKLDHTNEIKAIRQMSGLLIRQSKWAELLKNADRLIEIPGGETIGYTLMGQVHSFINPDNPKLLIDAFEKVLELDPKLERMPLPRSFFWSSLAKAHIKEGRSAESRKYLTRALDEGKSNLTAQESAELLGLLGDSYMLEQDQDEAESCWRKAVQFNPKATSSWLSLGRLEMRKGRFKESLVMLKKAIEIDPDSFEAHYVLSQVYRRMGRVDEAKQVEKNLEAARSRMVPTHGMGADSTAQPVPRDKPTPTPGSNPKH